MRKSKFNESQIVGILQDARSRRAGERPAAGVVGAQGDDARSACFDEAVRDFIDRHPDGAVFEC